MKGLLTALAVTLLGSAAANSFSYYGTSDTTCSGAALGGSSFWGFGSCVGNQGSPYLMGICFNGYFISGVYTSSCSASTFQYAISGASGSCPAVASGKTPVSITCTDPSAGITGNVALYVFSDSACSTSVGSSQLTGNCDTISGVAGLTSAGAWEMTGNTNQIAFMGYSTASCSGAPTFSVLVTQNTCTAIGSTGMYVKLVPGNVGPIPSNSAQPNPSNSAQPNPSNSAQPNPSNSAQPNPSSSASRRPNGAVGAAAGILTAAAGAVVAAALL